MALATKPNPSAPRRDRDALLRHYQIERELATRLRAAGPAERKVLYREVYNELFQRVPDHPQNTRKRSPADQQLLTDRQLKLLGHFLRPDMVYLEVGAGDCHLAMQVARRVKQVCAVDVSDFIAAADERPENFRFVLSDGVTIDVPAGSVHLAYSHQLMEHLHPDDATQQLNQIYRALAPGGQYVCVTPHRFSGPQDVSQFFDTEATGFHLKEYTYAELRKVFRRAGFASTSAWVGVKGRYFSLPEPLFRGVEAVMALWPKRLRRGLTRSVLLRSLFAHVQIVGRK